VEFNSFLGMNFIQSHENNVIKQVTHFLTRGYVSISTFQLRSTRNRPKKAIFDGFRSIRASVATQQTLLNRIDM
jgi:hypothetical protein